MVYVSTGHLRNSPPAIVLAAGRGERLQSGLPKPLTAVSGRTLLQRVFESCAEAGVRRVALALGFEADVIETHALQAGSALGLDVQCVRAPGWELGNGVSARIAAEHLAEPSFFLLMGDHLVAPGILARLRESPPADGGVALAVDLDPESVHDIDDATKVLVQGESFSAIGKTLSHWNAIDTGAFLCTRGLTMALATAQAGGSHQLSDGVRALAEAGRARAVDVTGHRWIDVDTFEALEEAERRLRAEGRSAPGP